MAFEDINLPNNKYKKSRNKKKEMNDKRTTKSTRGTYSNIKINNSMGMNTINSKLFSSQIKEVNPLPIKLGEIKEIDSITADSTGRNFDHEENKKDINKSKLNEEGSNILVKDNNSIMIIPLEKNKTFYQKKKKFCF